MADNLELNSKALTQLATAQRAGDQLVSEQWSIIGTQAQEITKRYLSAIQDVLSEKRGFLDDLLNPSHSSSFLSLASANNAAAAYSSGQGEATKQWNTAILHAQNIVENSLQIAKEVSISSNWRKDRDCGDVKWTLSSYLSSTDSSNKVAADCLERETSYISQAAEARTAETQQVLDRRNALVLQAQVITERW